MGDIPEQVFIDAAQAFGITANYSVAGTPEMAGHPPFRAAVASAYRAGQAATPDGPRRWALPDEPGPEVTAVRNAAGGTWDRDGRGWTYQNFAFPWVQLLRDLGPLTDATPAADGQDGDGRG